MNLIKKGKEVGTTRTSNFVKQQSLDRDTYLSVLAGANLVCLVTASANCRLFQLCFEIKKHYKTMACVTDAVLLLQFTRINLWLNFFVIPVFPSFRAKINSLHNSTYSTIAMLLFYSGDYFTI